MTGRRGFLGALAAMLPFASALKARPLGGYVPVWDQPWLLHGPETVMSLAQFDEAEIARWFGVPPPTYISDGLLRSTTVNITDFVNEGFKR